MNILEVVGQYGTVYRGRHTGLSQNIITQALGYIWHDGSISDEQMLQYYGDENSDVDTSDPRVGKSRALRRWFRYHFTDRIESVYWDIEQRVQNGQLPVYREITAPVNWQPDPNRHPGNYWSWDEHAAEAHWGSFKNGDVKWLLVGQATLNQIDWVGTLAKNASYDYESEKEIQLKPGARVALVRWEQRR